MNANQKGTALIDGALTDETLASSDSVLAAGMYGQGHKGLQQFYSPPSLARLARSVFGSRVSVLDPTAGDGSLLKEFDPSRSFGVEIDGDQIKASEGSYNALKGDFQHFYTLLRLGLADWPVIVANPPFGLQWEDPTLRGGKRTNSTVLTFMMINRLLSERGQFMFVCGQARHDRQIAVLEEYAGAYAVLDCDDLFEGTRIPNSIIFGMHPAIRSASTQGIIARRKVTSDMLDLCGDWVKEARDKAIDPYENLLNHDHSYMKVEQIKSLQVEYDRRLEKRIKTREFDAQLVNGNHIQWLPSPFAQLALNQAGLAYDFNGLNGQPVAYFAQNERLWFKLGDAEERGLVRIDPRLREAVGHTLGDIQRIRIPLYELKPQQRLGFLDDIDSLKCVKSDPERKMVAGNIYQLDTTTKTIVEKSTELVESKKEPGEYVEKTFERHKKVMCLTITGHGARYSMYDGGDQASQNIAWLVSHFEIPDPGQISTRHPQEIARLEALVTDILEEFKERSTEWEKKNKVSMPFTLRPFQAADIARLLFKNFGLLTWEQGLGKTVGMFAFAEAAWRSGAKKKLLIVTAADLIDQTVRECERFMGITPTVIKTHGQAKEIATHLRRGGEGVYITHYEAMSVVGTMRKNIQLPVITVKEWTEQKLIRGTDRHGYWYLVPVSDIDKPVEEQTIYANLDHLMEETGLKPVGDQSRSEFFRELLDAGNYVQFPTKQYYAPNHTDKRCAYGYIRPRYGKVVKKLTSKDICPECNADTRNGWGGLFCDAEGPDGSKCGYAHFSCRVKPIGSLLTTAFHDGVACLDEITYIQGDTSKRSKVMRGVQARYRLGTSGTPIKNYVDQIFWPLAWCLGYSKPWFPYDYQGGKARFEADFCVIQFMVSGRKRESRKVLPDVTNLSRFWRMLSSCTIRRRAEETGEKIVDIWYHEVNVPTSVGQSEQNREWLKKMPHGFPALFTEKYPESKVVKAGMQDILAPILGLNWKLDYAMTVPEGDPDHEWTGIPVSNWTPAHLRALELTMALVKQGRKVLFGSHIVAEGKWVAERLQEKGVKAVHIVDEQGTTVAAKKRSKLVYSFQTDPNVQVFCAGMKAIRLGHNLDAADAVVLNGLDFDYETLDQFVKRVRRLTSKNDVDVFVLLPTLSGQETITSRKWQLLGMKGNAADLALDGRLILKHEQTVSEQEMINELQARGFHVTDDAIDDAEIERAWDEMPNIEDFDAEGKLPERAAVIEEVPDEAEVGQQLAIGEEPVIVVPDEAVLEQNKVEFDAIDAAEEELATLELPNYDPDGPVATYDDQVNDESEPGLLPIYNDPDFMDESEDEPTDEPLVAPATKSDDLPLDPFSHHGGQFAGGVIIEPEATASAEEQTFEQAAHEDPAESALNTGEPEVEDATVAAFAPAPFLDPIATIKGAKELLDLGIIEADEFARIKQAQLAAMGVAA